MVEVCGQPDYVKLQDEKSIYTKNYNICVKRVEMEYLPKEYMEETNKFTMNLTDCFLEVFAREKTFEDGMREINRCWEVDQESNDRRW